MSIAILFAKCAHLVAIKGDIKEGEKIEAVIKHSYCPECDQIAEEMQRQMQRTMDEVEGWSDESSN